MINTLIKDNEWLIYSIASKYSDYYNIEDLYQAGVIGIIKASKSYKDNYNVKFSTYAYKSVLGEIIDFIRKDRNIVLSDEAYCLYKKYIKVKELLYNKYEREASFSEICSFMGISEQQLLNIIESISFTRSIDSDNQVYNSLSNDDMSRIEDTIFVQEELDKLSEVDKRIIDYRYYQGYTQSETANIMGLSQVKVSRQEKLILSKIKNNIVK